MAMITPYGTRMSVVTSVENPKRLMMIVPKLEIPPLGTVKEVQVSITYFVIK